MMSGFNFALNINLLAFSLIFGCTFAINQWKEIGPNFWNARGPFKVFHGFVDIGAHMSMVRLNNGKFLVIDTIQMTPSLRSEIDQMTSNGSNIEAVIAVHPFHTLAFPAFYEAYPNVPYYGTPRHLRKLTQIPWVGSLLDCTIRRKWEPDVELRIPAGAEFVNPLPEETNHFTSVLVLHKPSRTLHVDDTLIYVEDPSFIQRMAGVKKGFTFHPSMETDGLYSTVEAPLQFRDWMKALLRDWSFDNVCAAHIGIKIGGAHAKVEELVNQSEETFQRLSEKNRGKNSTAPQNVVDQCQRS